MQENDDHMPTSPRRNRKPIPLDHIWILI
jgi:hypothetical protein